MTAMPSPDTLKRLATIVGDRYAIQSPADMVPYLIEWREIWTGKTPMVLRPSTHRGSLAHPRHRQ